MSESKLTFNADKLIHDAFYSIPDFTDVDGNHISGIYGALYKLLAELKKGDVKEIDISFDRSIENLTPAVFFQIDKLGELLGEKRHLTAEDISFLEEKLAASALGGSFEAPPVISIKYTETSDLNEVEQIFERARKYGEGSPENYIGYYVLFDNPSDGKKGRALGLSICFEDRFL